MKNIFLLLVFTFCGQQCLYAQGWLQTYYDISASYFNSRAQKTTDGGYIIAGVSGNAFVDDVTVRKVDAFGQVQWNYVLPKQFRQTVRGVHQFSVDGSYAIFYDNRTGSDRQLLRLTATGQFISDQSLQSYPYLYDHDIELTSHNEFLMADTYTDSTTLRTMRLTKLDSAGNTIWQQLYTHDTTVTEFAVSAKQTTDGNYLIVGYQGIVTNPSQYTGTDVRLIKVDTSGTILWQQTYNTTSYNRPHGLLATNDGGCLVLGLQSVPGGDDLSMMQKIDAAGTSQWTWTTVPFGGIRDGRLYNAVELNNGDFVATGVSNYLYQRIALVRVTATGQLVLNRGLLTGVAADQGYTIYSNTGGSGFTIFGHNGSGPFLMAMDSLGAIYSNHIVGHYYNDYNNNCIQDAGEPAIPNQVIVAKDSNRYHYGTTAPDGSYDLEVDTGNYKVYANLNSPYWSVCPDTQQVNLTTPNSIDTINFALQATDSCLHLDVAISSPRLRRCFPSYYRINYRNIGTKVAQNAYIEVTLDPYLTYDSSSIALTQQTGNTYRFDVGTLPAFYNNSFVLYVTVDCDSTTLGQIHCSQAHIFPDTVCAPIIWTGSIIDASSTCTNDSITFRLYNRGSSMGSTRMYTIVEEHVMIRQAPFQLGAGMDTLITIPTTRDNYYRIEANQESGFPPEMGDPVAIADNIGCRGRIPLNTPTILGQYYQGNTSSFVAVDCQANIGSYDPNDKNAQPQGYQANHYVNNTTALNYHIRFQNTGTDTAFTVVVVDTLDAALDPASIVMGASSHAYTWQLRENGILVVTFNHIMLPDSNVNEPLSNGFFKFNIHQRPNNPDGTRIENRAAIYFDFNPPIITNTVFHTIGSDFINSFVISVDKISAPKATVKVFPNPFADYTTIAVEGKAYEQLQVQVFSITGQLVKQQQSATNQLTLTRENLPAGVYLYQLFGDQERISSGKIIIQTR
ncbi:MAG: T9SS type A sorting domain-containing protein [Aureispira sp.]